MSDFMRWLHANYIRPQFHIQIVHDKLAPANRINLEYVLEFTAIQAFLLGFRTSEGLPPLPPRTRGA